MPLKLHTITATATNRNMDIFLILLVIAYAISPAETTTFSQPVATIPPPVVTTQVVDTMPAIVTTPIAATSVAATSSLVATSVVASSSSVATPALATSSTVATHVVATSSSVTTTVVATSSSVATTAMATSSAVTTATTVTSPAETTATTTAGQSVPSDPPKIFVTVDNNIIEVDNGSTLHVEVEKALTIRCIVEGGLPAVSNVSLTYASETKTVSGTEVTTKLTMNNSLALVQFTCGAEHVSGLYDQETSFTLDILTPAVISNYTMNNKTDRNIELRDGDRVTFECDASGYPAPELKIKGKKTNVTLSGQTSSEGKNLSSIIATIETIRVWQTDIYACFAEQTAYRAVRARRATCTETLVNTDTEKDVNIVIIGPPSLPNPNDDPPNAQTKTNGEVLAVVEVVSNPAPKNYTLVKIVELEDGNTTETVISSDKYTVDLTKVDCRTSILRLSTTDSDIKENKTSYRLTIDNGEGTPASFTLPTEKATVTDEGSDSDDSDYVLEIVLGTMAAVILVVLVVVMVLYFSKKNRVGESPTPSDEDLIEKS